MPGPSYYIWFRKTTGDPDFVQGQIAGNHKSYTMDYDANLFAHPTDPTNYGVLEVAEGDHTTMESSMASGGTYGKHVDDPEGTPTLADGDPS